MRHFLFTILTIVISLPSWEQTNAPQDDKSFKDKVEATKVAYFTERLELTPEEAQVFWPIYNKWWKDKMDAHHKVHTTMKAIVDLDKKGGYTDPQMKKLINEHAQSLSLESQVFEIYLEEFYKVLPVSKVAKIFAAESGFREILMNMWKEQHRKERRESQKKETK